MLLVLGNRYHECGGCHTHPQERKRATILIVEEVAPLAALDHSDTSCSDAHSNEALRQVEHEPPRLMPPGYAAGMQLYFTGPSLRSSGNNWLVQGARGEVTGPAVAAIFEGKGVAMRFPNNKTSVDCFCHELSREAPPLPCVTEGVAVS